MKKVLLMLVLTLVVQGLWAMDATVTNRPTVENNSGETKIPHRLIYGFFLNSYDFGGDYGIGTFYSDNTNAAELLFPFAKETAVANLEGIYSGAAADGVYYGAVYKYQEMGPPLPGNLIAIDLNTGKRTDIGPWNQTEDEDRSALKLQDMTYSYKDKTMYVLGYMMGSQTLYSIDLTTAKMEAITEMKQTCSSLACNYEGQLFVMTNSGNLCKLDKETGNLTVIKETGYGSPMTSNSLEFDHTDGSLYWACNSYDKDNGSCYTLIRFTFEGEQVEFSELGTIGSIPSGVVFYGMYIPYVLDGEDTPDTPTDVRITPDSSGKLEAVISWTNPTVTFGNEELTDLTSVTILRNGEKIATVSTTVPGEKMEYKDTTVPDNGEWSYVIYASNSQGDGERKLFEQYIGKDLPAEVENLQANPYENGCKKIQLTWNNPEKGAHGLYCDPSQFTYKIVRYPDEMTIAEGLKDTEYIDEDIKRLAAYYYTVYAVNEIGETPLTSNAVIAGKAMEAPYLETFANTQAIGYQWTGVDANEDRYQWTFNSGAGYYTFKDQASAAEYFINPTFTPADIYQDADEWIITPPIRLEAGKQYVLSFDYRSISTENLEVTMGESNSIEAQSETLENWELPAIPAETNEFINKKMEIPASDTEIIRCFGFHLSTPFPTNRFSFIQITNIEVKESNGSSIETEIADEISLKNTGDALLIEGVFEKAEIYNLSGLKIIDTKARIIPTQNMPQGIYIVRIIQNEQVKISKVYID